METDGSNYLYFIEMYFNIYEKEYITTTFSDIPISQKTI